MTRKLIIEDIRATGWRLHLRDEETGEVEDVAFEPKDAWRLLRATGGDRETTPRVEGAAITLHVDNMGGVGVVHVTVKGPGAAAWSERTGGILGTIWRHNAEGDPNVVLDDSREFLDDLRREFPDVTIDDSLYLPGITPPSPSGDETSADAHPRVSPPQRKKQNRRRRKAGRRQAPESEEDEDDLPNLPPDAEITLKLDNLDREDGTVLITAQGDRAGAWAKAQGTLLGSRWEHADGLPHVLVMDDVELPKQVQREHPKVRLDIVEYVPRSRDELIRMEARATHTQPSSPAPSEPVTVQSPLEVGPGGLVWSPIQDRGIDGAAARWLDGQFKVLHAAGRQHALFYEYDHGGYVHIACGEMNVLKQLAGATPMLEQPRGSINHELARLACPMPAEAPAMPEPGLAAAMPESEPEPEPERAPTRPVARVSLSKIQREIEEERQTARDTPKVDPMAIPPDIEARLRQVAEQVQL